MYKVWHILDSPQDFVFSLFSTCSSLFFFKFLQREIFYNLGRHCQIVLWRIPWHSRSFTVEALGANGESYGASDEGSLFSLLQALASRSSFSRCRFLEGDTSSLWYELRTRDVDRKALDVCLFLCFDRAKDVMAQDVEWIFCFIRGKKIPQA
jgi:hypothetical protein